MSIEPTTQGRIVALDVLRGFAVLGILIANIPSFASVDWGGSPSSLEGMSIADRWIHALSLVFVNGKFRSMLAVLFGVGVWLQFQKRSKVEGNWPGGYIKRSLWLGAIGLCHGLFIWHGDILLFYAGMAIVTALLVNLDPKILKAIIGGLLVLALLCGGGLTSAMLAISDYGKSSEMDWFLSDRRIEHAFRYGSYLDQLTVRSIMFAFMMVVEVVLAFLMVPLFLLGVLFARTGVLQQPSAHRTTRNAALIVGFGVGLPLNLLGLLALRGVTAVEVLPELATGPLLAVGYLMLLAIAIERGRLIWLTRHFEAVGRTALTCYLMQSVICTTIFYSWGLGLFGQLNLVQQMGIVVLVWIVNIVFARLWLTRFSIGPVEWLWRSLTEGRRLPMRVLENRNEAVPVP